MIMALIRGDRAAFMEHFWRTVTALCGFLLFFFLFYNTMP